MWKNETVEKCFQHLSREWTDVQILSEQGLYHSYYVSINDKIFALSFYDSAWRIYALDRKYKEKEIGCIKNLLEITPDRLLDQMKSIFHPQRLQELQKWQAFLQIKIRDADSKSNYAIYQAKHRIMDIYHRTGQHHDRINYEYRKCIEAKMPFHASNMLQHLLNTTAHANQNGMISTDSSLSFFVPNTAHQLLDAQNLAHELIEADFYLS